MRSETTESPAPPPELPLAAGRPDEQPVSYAVTLTLAMAGGLGLWALIFLLGMALRQLFLAG